MCEVAILQGDRKLRQSLGLLLKGPPMSTSRRETGEPSEDEGGNSK
jgi:hypothetical protein